MSSLAIAAPRSYTIRPRAFYIHEGLSAEEEVDFHVQAGDYFPTLATIMGLLAEFLDEAAKKNEAPRSFQIMALKALKQDLMYADRTYRIVPRSPENTEI